MAGRRRPLLVGALVLVTLLVGAVVLSRDSHDPPDRLAELASQEAVAASEPAPEAAFWGCSQRRTRRHSWGAGAATDESSTW